MYAIRSYYEMPKLYPVKADFEKVKVDKSYYCLAPTSVWFTKQYPKDKWIVITSYSIHYTKLYDSMRDSVKIVGTCKKINKKLNKEQKVVVLVRLYELVNADRKFSSNRMHIINTVADVFKLPKERNNFV